MSKTVVGVFDSLDEAQTVKRDLVGKGYSSENINVVSKESSGQARTAYATQGTQTSHETGIGDKLSHFFRSLTGGSTADEGYYTETLRNGGAMVAVNVPDDGADEVADLLDDYGAQDVDEQGGKSASTAARSATNTPDPTAIPIVEEEITVGKREVRRGGIRVYSRVVETPVETDVQLREEHVRVERRPVDRPATEADFNMGHDQTIELTETAEEAVVGKRSRVVEEVLVGKETTERTQTIKDKVRKTEVSVENLSSGSDSPRSFSEYEPAFRRDFESNYSSSGGNYQTYAPAYEYGYKLATDPRYTASDYSAVEPQARADWTRQGKGSWEQFKNAVRSGWDNVRR
ncbi:MAG: DUF2382 domain-containing protein [Bryobacterales bacterium]|nr:DUF2382 domain-containing protein [Bryobacterales bacterium]